LIKPLEFIQAFPQILNGAVLHLKALPEHEEQNQQQRNPCSGDKDPEAFTHRGRKGSIATLN
jgi:hypothetical protein